MWPRLVGGVLLLLLGGVWFLQGIGTLGGSAMTGQAFWAVAGTILGVIGVALLVAAGRFRGRGDPPD